MLIDTLASYKIKPEILQAWRETIGTELLPVQEHAVLEGVLSANGRVVVISPPGSGKTFIGEMAAARVASEDGKVFYVVPLRAQFFVLLIGEGARYARAGIKVVISSRDHREFDGDIERGNFQIAIVVVEKLLSMIVGTPQILNTVGLVVVDELHLIGDATRGADLEFTLTMIKNAKSKPRIINGRLRRRTGRFRRSGCWASCERPARLFAMRGVPLKVAATIEMTMRYAHLSPETK
jgi:replicative superfamily II helicase